MITVTWLRSHPSRWTTFVANRVNQIQELLPATVWRHVPTRDNPADCASRGLQGSELSSHALWWHGPSWLALSRENWPSDSTEQYDYTEEEKIASFHITSPNIP